jgi:hypothetical protein
MVSISCLRVRFCTSIHRVFLKPSSILTLLVGWGLAYSLECRNRWLRSWFGISHPWYDFLFSPIQLVLVHLTMWKLRMSPACRDFGNEMT